MSKIGPSQPVEPPEGEGVSPTSTSYNTPLPEQLGPSAPDIKPTQKNAVPLEAEVIIEAAALNAALKSAFSGVKNDG